MDNPAVAGETPDMAQGASPRKSTGPGQLGLLALLLCAVPAWADNNDEADAAPLFKKLLDYDRAASGKPGAYVVLVVHDTPAEAQGALTELRKVGVAAIAAPVAQLSALLPRASAAYVVPRAARPEVLAALEAARVLTLSASAPLVMDGKVSLGMTRGAGGRPELVVHLARLKVEGHTLPASVLQLMRVIR